MTASEQESGVADRRPGGTAMLAGQVVARIGFGAMQLEYRSVARETALGLLRQAIDAGINHIDTAQFYGACNGLIHDALAPYPGDLVLASKVGADRDVDGKLIPAQRPEQLRAQVEANLTGLGVEQVSVVNLRRLDAWPGLIAQGDQKVDLDSQLAELTALRQAGKIGAIGLSNVSADQLRQALPIGITCVQNSYSVLDRSAEPVLELCAEHNIAWVPFFFPLGSAGFPNLSTVTGHPTVIAIGAQTDASPAQVGLRWLLEHYDNTLLIPGTTNPTHLDENIAAGQRQLSPLSMAALDQLSRPDRPDPATHR